MDNTPETSFVVRMARILYQAGLFVWEKIKAFLSEFYTLGFKSGSELAPYISFFVIIAVIVLIILFATGTFKGKAMKDVTKSFKPITSTFKRAFKFVIPGSNKKMEGIPRAAQDGGRCDMIQWKDAGKYCRKSSAPNDIIWTLDVSKMDELGMLPQNIQDKLTENRLEIRIPYKLVGMKYIPDCSKMTYSDGTPAKLFAQKKLSDKMCYFVDKQSKKYT